MGRDLASEQPPLQLQSIRSTVVGVTERTNWVHVVIEGPNGQTGVGEATLDGYEDLVEDRIRQLATRIGSRSIRSIPLLVDEIGIENTPANLVDAAALSGIEQALWDLLGRTHGLSVHALLGTPAPSPIRLYANINRALLTDRTSSAFASKAGEAMDAGFSAIKCSPFDGLRRANLEDRQDRSLLKEGITRLNSLKRLMRGDIDLIVDCAYRFTSRSAKQVLSVLEEYQPFWLEALVAENRLEEWAEIRASTTVRLAGGEMMTGLKRFNNFMTATKVDVVMPDVKYAGGISGIRSIGSIASALGVWVAPHNPSGPVSTLASFHAMSGLHNGLILEYAFGEASWRADLVCGAELINDGFLQPPERPGLGFDFSGRVATDHPKKRVRGMDLRANG